MPYSSTTYRTHYFFPQGYDREECSCECIYTSTSRQVYRNCGRIRNLQSHAGNCSRCLINTSQTIQHLNISLQEKSPSTVLAVMDMMMRDKSFSVEDMKKQMTEVENCGGQLTQAMYLSLIQGYAAKGGFSLEKAITKTLGEMKEKDVATDRNFVGEVLLALSKVNKNCAFRKDGFIVSGAMAN